MYSKARFFDRFNTQPPEGGWDTKRRTKCQTQSFNTQPPEGGWLLTKLKLRQLKLGFNTQPPEGGWGVGRRRRGSITTFQHTAA